MPSPLPPGTAVRGARYGVLFAGTVRHDRGDVVQIHVARKARYGWRAILDVPRATLGCWIETVR